MENYGVIPIAVVNPSVSSSYRECLTGVPQESLLAPPLPRSPQPHLIVDVGLEFRGNVNRTAQLQYVLCSML